MDKEEALENLSEEGIEEEDIAEYEAEYEGENPEMPEFPILIFILAVIKDIIDIAGLGFGGTIANIFVAPILFFYMWGKVGFVRKKMYRKFVFAAFIGFVPGANLIVPESTVFVLLSYLQEQKQIGKIIEYFETFAMGTAKKAA